MRSTVIERITKFTQSKSPASQNRERTGTATRSGVAKLLRMPIRRAKMLSLRERVAASFITHGIACDAKFTHHRTMEFYASSKNDWTRGLSRSRVSTDPWPIAV